MSMLTISAIGFTQAGIYSSRIVEGLSFLRLKVVRAWNEQMKKKE